MSCKNEKYQRVRCMFDRIAHRYDLLNHILSACSDILWRRSAVRVLNASAGDLLLDLATGTGDLALEAVKKQQPPRSIIGIDVAEKMMRIGQEKIASHTECSVRFVGGSAEDLPFRSAVFDGAMVAFGVRNFADINKALQGIRYVLKPGGRLVVLELSYPRYPIIRHLYHFYTTYVMTWIGSMISGDSRAYRYLQVSVVEFPAREGLRSLMNHAGFVDTGWRDLSLGVATLYWGDKPS